MEDARTAARRMLGEFMALPPAKFKNTADLIYVFNSAKAVEDNSTPESLLAIHCRRYRQISASMIQRVGA